MSKKKLKIAIYSGTIPSTTFVERLIEGLSKHYEILVFGVKNNSKKYTSNNVKVHSTSRNFLINFIKTKWHVFVLFFTNPRRLIIVLKELQKHKSLYSKWHTFTRLIPVVRFLPDVFHIQWAKDLESFMFLKDKLHVKLVLSLRGAHINYSPIANLELAESYKINFPKVDAFHAVSHAIGLEAQKYQANASKITVIHSPLTQEIFKHFQAFQKSTTKTIKICTVGRFHWIKGLNYLLDALTILQEHQVSFQYICVSSNKIDEVSLFQINQLGLKNQINIINNLNQENLFKVMQSTDVLVLPSLKEGIANVVIEAMAIGVPVISTNCGGMSEVVKHQETGWLVPTRDAQAIAEAIMEVAQTPETDLQRITLNAHQLVKTEFNAEKSIQEFEALYLSVVK